MTDSAAGSFFRVENDRFIANDAARGPWVADACHAGPVTGLIARALEHAVPDKQLTRITVNFQRPVPMSEILIEASIERDGRSTARGTAIGVAGLTCRFILGADRCWPVSGPAVRYGRRGWLRVTVVAGAADLK